MKLLIALIASFGIGLAGLFGGEAGEAAGTGPRADDGCSVTCTAEPTEDGRCRITCIDDAGETCSIVVDCDAIEDCQDVDPTQGCTPGGAR